MQKAIVKSISVKEGDNAKGHWINTQITTTDGAKLGSFEHRLSKLNEGDEFEFEAEIKGDRVNIKAGTFKLTKSSPVPIATPFEAPEPHNKQISIEGIAALHELGDMIRSERGATISGERINLYWKIVDLKLFDWTGIEIKPQPVTPPVTPTATKKEDKTPPRQTSAQSGASKTSPTPNEIKPETIKEINDLAQSMIPDNKTIIQDSLKYMYDTFKKQHTNELTEEQGQQLLGALRSGKIVKEKK